MHMYVLLATVGLSAVRYGEFIASLSSPKAVRVNTKTKNLLTAMM